MWGFLKSNTPDSSLRVNMLIITIPIGFILGSVAAFILHRTFVPLETTIIVNPLIKHTYTIKYVFAELPWLALGGFVGTIIAALVTLWFGKKINKDAENQTPKPGDPAQPNINA